MVASRSPVLITIILDNSHVIFCRCPRNKTYGEKPWLLTFVPFTPSFSHALRADCVAGTVFVVPKWVDSKPYSYGTKCSERLICKQAFGGCAPLGYPQILWEFEGASLAVGEEEKRFLQWKWCLWWTLMAEDALMAWLVALALHSYPLCLLTHSQVPHLWHGKTAATLFAFKGGRKW